MDDFPGNTQGGLLANLSHTLERGPQADFNSIRVDGTANEEQAGQESLQHEVEFSLRRQRRPGEGDHQERGEIDFVATEKLERVAAQGVERGAERTAALPDKSWSPTYLRRSSGTNSRRTEPSNSCRGRPIFCSGSEIISFHWAIQPTVRASANIAVNMLTGMPIAL